MNGSQVIRLGGVDKVLTNLCLSTKVEKGCQSYDKLIRRIDLTKIATFLVRLLEKIYEITSS